MPIRTGTNMASGNQQKHISLSFATKAWIYLSKNSKTQNNYNKYLPNIIFKQGTRLATAVFSGALKNQINKLTTCTSNSQILKIANNIKYISLKLIRISLWMWS